MSLVIDAGYLILHLKHDVPHLELLSRRFGTIDSLEWIAWVVDVLNSGQDAQRAGFLYEFFMGQELDINAEIAGGTSMSWMIRNG